MKKILFLVLMVLSVMSYGQTRTGVLDRSVHATQVLETDADTIVVGDTTVYPLDVAYLEWSSDNVTFRKNYITGDKYVRYSGHSKQDWDTIVIADNVDSIYTVADSVFPVQYVYYITNGDTILVTQFSQEDGLVFGGIVTHQGDLTYAVSPAAYFINNVFYKSPYNLITVDSADATYDRTDLFAVDTNGVSLVIAGTPSANPLTPSYDPSYQIPLTTVDIAANDNSGTNINSEVVYDENIEWTSNSVGTVADFNSNVTVYHGSKSASVSNISSNEYIAWVDSTTTYVIDSFYTLSFWLQLKDPIGLRDNIDVQFLNNGAVVSTPYNINLDRANGTSWQFVSVSLNAITFSSLSFDEIRVIYSPRRSTFLAGYYIDYVLLQGGISTPAEPGLVTLYGDVTGSGTSIVLTDITPNIVSSVDGVTNDQGNIDLVQSGIVTITPNDGANTITIDATETDPIYANDSAQIVFFSDTASIVATHNYVNSTLGANDIIAGTALSGGGNMSSDVTLNVDITELTNLPSISTIDALNDSMLIFDHSAGTHKKITPVLLHAPVYVDDIENAVAPNYYNFSGTDGVYALGGGDGSVQFRADTSYLSTIYRLNTTVDDSIAANYQNLSIDSTGRVFTISIDNGNSISFKDSVRDLSGYVQFSDTASVIATKNDIAIYGVCNYGTQTLSGTTDTLNVASGVNGILSISGNTTIRIEPTATCNTGNITILCEAAADSITFTSDYTLKVSPYLGLSNGKIPVTNSATGIDVYSYWFDGTRLVINGTKNYE